MGTLPLLELATDDPQAAERVRAALAIYPDLVTALSLAEDHIAVCEDPLLVAHKPGLLSIIRKALSRAERAAAEGATVEG